MAIQTLPGGVIIPPIPAGSLTSFALSTNASFDASDEAAGTIFQMPKTGNVRKVLWGTGTVTTGATVEVRLETVDAATGLPTGTLIGTTTNANVVVANADDNVFFSTTLTLDAAVTAGQIVALVIKNPTASFGNMQVRATPIGSDANFPYSALRQASWATNASGLLMFALEYDDGTVVPIAGILPPATSINASTAVGTGTTPDVMGLRFQLPLAARAIGGWAWIDDDGDFDLKLVSTAYNQGAGTGVIASISKDKDTRRGGAGGITILYFTAAVDLAAATNYRLVVEPTSATTLAFRDYVLGSIECLDAFCGGRNFHLTTAKDPTADGSWTNYNSGTCRMPAMGLILGGFDDATGGGGGTSRARVQRRM